MSRPIRNLQMRATKETMGLVIPNLRTPSNNMLGQLIENAEVEYTQGQINHSVTLPLHHTMEHKGDATLKFDLSSNARPPYVALHGLLNLE